MAEDNPYWRKATRGVMFSVPLLLAFALVSAVASSDDPVVVGCSGFVQASAALGKLRKSSDPKLDYSDITVQLQNEEGLVKDRTQCAPNGYFFLPVYGKGSFVVTVRGPDGWNFEPGQVSVIVDKTSCNDNKDINFQYTGFSLSGRVLGAPGGSSCGGETSKGPGGVTVTLSPIENSDPTVDGKAIAATTDTGGRFSFDNLSSGKYRIAASHPTWQISTVGSTEIELGWGKGEAPDVFQVAGYDLQGSVLAQGNPVLGVQIFLFSDEVKSVSCPPLSGASPVEGKVPLCQAVTGQNGKFVFNTLPCGEYTLIPYYKGEATVFDVSPSEVKVKVGHGTAVIAKPFEVTGFSVGGRVIDSAGVGIEGVKVLVDGKERAITDASGVYKLDQVISARYTISASKDHYKFTNLEDFLVLPNLASLLDIRATEFAVCGSVQLDGDQFSVKRSIALTHGPENVKPQAKMSSKDGDFCFTVPPGDYRLSPVVSQVETVSGLLFSPSYIDVSVTSRPVENIIFKQGHLSISGKIKCIDFCPKTLKLSLDPLNANSVAKPQTLYMEEDKESFTFDWVIPGKYSLKVENEVPGEAKKYGDRWCWEEKKTEVEVINKDVKGVTFKQTGWILRINSTNPASTTIAHDVIEPLEFDFKKGMNEICLPASGDYTLLFMYQCVFFGALMSPYTTEDPSPINLVAQLYLVQGTIKVDSRLWKDASNLTDYIYPSVFTRDGLPLNLRSFAGIRDIANESQPYAIYEFSHWGKFGERLAFKPRHNGKLQEEVLDAAHYERIANEQEQQQQQQQQDQGQTSGSVDPDTLEARQRIAQEAQSAGSVRDLIKMQAISNPAVTGKWEDPDELEEKIRLRNQAFGLKTEEEAQVSEEEEQTETPLETSESDEEAINESTEDGTEDGEAVVEEPEDNTPWAGRAPVDPEEAFPPRKRVLFYPRQIFHDIDREECQPHLPVFEARLGVYLEGKVVPPLENVNITVITETSSANAGWKEGEEVLWTSTQKEGLYVAGPLYDDATYSVKASKPGYDFRAIDKFSFEGQKLGQISVSFKFLDLSENILPAVLLLLSGDGGYRKNLVTPPGKGLVFDSLFPGSFYLRPILKEYSFTPQALAIDLKGGETKDVIFEANRVAFSAFGTVASLGGLPEEGVHIEAQSQEGGLYETTETDSKGNFRLRGLVPDTKYSIGVVLENQSGGSSKVERASPHLVEVKVNNNDVEGINFVVFYQGEGFDVYGSVEGPDFDKWQPHISVEAAPLSNPSRVEKVVPVPLSGFFELKGLSLEEYIVRLKFGLPGHSHIFESEPEIVDLRSNKREKVVKAKTLRFRAEERRARQDLTPTAVLPIVLTILVIALFASLSRLKDGYQWAVGGSSGGSSSANGWLPAVPKKKPEAQKQSQRKRTY